LAFNVKLWAESFHADFVPPFPCPACRFGRLEFVPRSLRSKDHALFCSTKLFQLLLKCNSADCAAVISVAGRTEIGAVFSDGEHEEFLRPQSMIPAPRIIDIPDNTPREVRVEIEKSFELFWVDLGSCANRLRISVERIMDHAGIIGNNLAQRISRYSSGGAAHAKTMTAMRIVGNIGTHEGTIERNVLCDAYHVYEDALADLYGNRSANLDFIRNRIINEDGRYEGGSSNK
jgi:hypothetical protein